MGGPKPAVVPSPVWDNIPACLKARPQWVVWGWQKNADGEWTKPPFRAQNVGQLAKANDPSTWSKFELARDRVGLSSVSFRVDGVGFELSESDPYCVFDFDHCLDAESKITDPRVAGFVATLASYTEVSPSLTGLRVVSKGKLPPGRRKLGDFESYDGCPYITNGVQHSGGRYVTITGNVWPPGSHPLDIAERQAEVEAVYAAIFTAENHRESRTEERRASQPNSQSDSELLTRARNARNGVGERFSAVFDLCDWKGAGFPSKSEADLWTLGRLAFWTGRDAVRMESLFSISALRDDKWLSRPDYRERTITAAIEGCAECYTPHERNGKRAGVVKDKAAAPAAQAQDDRPIIQIPKGRRPFVITDAEKILLRDFERWGLFRFGEVLIHVSSWTEEDRRDAEKLNQKGLAVQRPAGAAVLRIPTPPLIDDIFGHAINFQRLDEKKSVWVPTDVPDKVAKQFLARGQWRMPWLSGVVSGPIVRADGSILSKQGYDPDTGLILRSDISWIEPTDFSRDAAALAAVNLFKPFDEFPFATTAAKSVLLSAILTGIQRRMLSTAPAHVFDANMWGSGKTLLADLVSIIVTGNEAPRVTIDDADETELKKLFIALLISNDPVILLDDITGPVQSATLRAILTGTTYQGRILGFSQERKLPTNCLFLLTGNNVVLLKDMPRRALVARIEVDDEYPDRRGGFTISDLKRYCREHRSELFGYTLTILAGYIRAGRPDMQLTPWGSFEHYSETVRAALVWASFPDPYETRLAATENDPEREDTLALFREWFECLGDQEVHAKELVALADEQEEKAIGRFELKYPELREVLLKVAPLKGRPQMLDPVSFGYWCRAHKGRAITSDGRRYQLKPCAKRNRGGVPWRMTCTEV